MGRVKLPAGIKKEKKLTVRFPKDKVDEIKSLCKENGLKGIQELFDVLIVSGLVFRNAKVIEYVREKKQEEKERYRIESMGKLGWSEPVDKQNTWETKCFMYNQDHKAFCDYLIEENIKKQWVWNILLVKGFLAQEPFIIDLINKWKDLKISARKKAVVRLSSDEYITVLPRDDANKILEEATKDYDNRVFDSSIEDMIKERLRSQQKEDQEEEDAELESELNKKIETLRKSRQAEVDFLVKPYREK